MSSGDTAWMLAATALVMVMLPGLAFFYGGLVRRKNVLSTIMHSFFGLAIISVVWVLWGYTLAFGPDAGGLGLVGGPDFLGFSGVTGAPDPRYSATIPHVLFATFQLMFAAITPALITGAFAERKRFAAFVIFTVLWSTFVYSPLAHWVWAPGGWLRSLGALDFAGGTVVHISSGVSAFVVAWLIGRRVAGEEMEPHDVPMTVLGAGLLWFGWFGFNAGSALAANGQAANALLVTNTAAGAATLTWCLASYLNKGKVSVVGAAAGAVAGLVAITPGVGVCHGRWGSRDRPHGRRGVLRRDPAAQPPAHRRCVGCLRGPRHRRNPRSARDGRVRGGGDRRRVRRDRGQLPAGGDPGGCGGGDLPLRRCRDVRHREDRGCTSGHPSAAQRRGDGPRPGAPRRGRLPDLAVRAPSSAGDCQSLVGTGALGCAGSVHERPQDPPGTNPCWLAVVHRDPAVDDDRVDADRGLAG